MLEIANFVIAYIPRYLPQFGRMIISPRLFLKGNDHLTNDPWASALLFYLLSLLIAITLSQISALSPAGFTLEYTAKRLMEAFFTMLTATVVIYFVWKLFAGLAKFGTVFLFCLYIYGTYEVVLRVAGTFVSGLIRAKDEALFEQILALRNSDGMTRISSNYFFRLDEHPVLIYVIAFTIAFELAVLIWYWNAWRALADISTASTFRSVTVFALSGAAIIFIRIWVPFLNYGI